MVTAGVEPFHEPIEDELEHEPNQRSQAFSIRLRDLEIQAHGLFSVNEISDNEIGAGNSPLNYWVVVDSHRSDDAGLNARSLAVGPIELSLNGFADERMCKGRLAVDVEPLKERIRFAARHVYCVLDLFEHVLEINARRGVKCEHIGERWLARDVQFPEDVP